jgi:hypothetical protein
MKPVDKEPSKNQIAATGRQLAGDLAHLRGLREGLLRTRDVITRAIVAFEDSRDLLGRMKMGSTSVPANKPTSSQAR